MELINIVLMPCAVWLQIFSNVCVCVQGCAGQPGGEDEYVERGSSFRDIYGCQEVSESLLFFSMREKERD